MAQKVDLQERLKMRFLTVDYRDKQEVYGTSDTASDTGTIALEILNIPYLSGFLILGCQTIRPFFSDFHINIVGRENFFDGGNDSLPKQIC